jgi:RhoGEF domain/Pleckstrin homology domain
LGPYLKLIVTVLLSSNVPPTREQVIESGELFRVVRGAMNDVLMQVKRFMIEEEKQRVTLGNAQRSSVGSLIKLAQGTVRILKELDAAVQEHASEEMFRMRLDAANKAMKRLNAVSCQAGFAAEAETLDISAQDFFALCNTVYRTGSESQLKSMFIQLGTLATALKSLIMVASGKARSASPRPSRPQGGGGGTLAPSASSAALSADDEEAKWRKNRELAVREIMSTEESYKTSLVTIFSLYMIPCKRRLGELLSPEQFDLLFGGIHEFIPIHKKLHESLEQRIAAASASLADVAVSDIFVDLAPQLLTYSRYINSFDERLRLYEQLQRAKDGKFSKFLLEVQQASEAKNLDLPAFLITPVQRLPRYEMLLKELLKWTPEHHADFARLTDAHLKVKEINAEVNQKKREQENTAKLRQLDRLISFEGGQVGDYTELHLDEPGRLFVREGSVHVLHATRKTINDEKWRINKDRSHNKPLHCLLFDDMLLLTKPVSVKTRNRSSSSTAALANGKEPELQMNYVIRHVVQLKKVRIFDAAAADVVGPKAAARMSDTSSLSLSLGVKLLDTLQYFVFFAPNPAERRSWHHELQSCCQIVAMSAF